jgi:cysteine-S-conjugate beta-lyase
MQDETLCVAPPEVSLDGFASLSVPIYRASTIVFSDAESYATRLSRGDDSYTYGLYGTPTSRALEKQIAALEKAKRCFLVPSGQAAVAISLRALLKSGDTLLLSDNIYSFIRDFAEKDLAPTGIKIAYYDPSNPANLESLLDPSVRMIWLESPGSTTMEIQDIPTLVAKAHARGILVGCDNTWATPYLFKPLDFGVDISVGALTKYLGGHSDILMGSIALNDSAMIEKIKGTIWRLGIGVSPDECSLVLRGIQTLSIRLAHCSAIAERLARRIQGFSAVENVLHPALEDFPNHHIWKRDFKGASGVFSVTLQPDSEAKVPQSLNMLKTFSIGASWGGTRSIIAPMTVLRTHMEAKSKLFLRFSVGLEAETDLLRDVEVFFAGLQGGLASPNFKHLNSNHQSNAKS